MAYRNDDNLEPQLLDLLQILVTSLAHRIRTPLSVISNDVAYWTETLPRGETERAQQQIRSISEVLGAAQNIVRPYEPHSIGPISRLSQFSQVESGPSVRISPATFQRALENVVELLRQSGIPNDGTWSYEVEEAEVILRLGSAMPNSVSVHQVVTTFALQKLGEVAVLGAVFIDVVIKDSGANVRIYEEPFAVEIRIPVAKSA